MDKRVPMLTAVYWHHEYIGIQTHDLLSTVTKVASGFTFPVVEIPFGHVEAAHSELVKKIGGKKQHEHLGNQCRWFGALQ
jgi:hypothetical protein